MLEGKGGGGGSGGRMSGYMGMREGRFLYAYWSPSPTRAHTPRHSQMALNGSPPLYGQ